MCMLNQKGIAATLLFNPAVVPQVTSMVTPVIFPARSEARKVATLAISAIRGSSFSIVSSSNFEMKSFTSSAPFSSA